MSEQEKNQEALKQLGIEIPEGWEFVRYGHLSSGCGHYITAFGEVSLWNGIDSNLKFIIIKKKIETDCWYLVEDMEKDRSVKFLDDEYTWRTFIDPKYSAFVFDDCKIISKMVVEK